MNNLLHFIWLLIVEINQWLLGLIWAAALIVLISLFLGPNDDDDNNNNNKKIFA